MQNFCIFLNLPVQLHLCCMVRNNYSIFKALLFSAIPEVIRIRFIILGCSLSIKCARIKLMIYQDVWNSTLPNFRPPYIMSMVWCWIYSSKKCILSGDFIHKLVETVLSSLPIVTPGAMITLLKLKFSELHIV